MCGKVVWKFRAGLGGSCSQLSAGSCTRSKLVVVTSSSLERQPLSPKHQPVWHWACLNRDPFAFQVQHNKQQQRGKKWVINREVVVVLHCGTAGIQLCHPASPGQGEGLGKLVGFPCPLHILWFSWSSGDTRETGPALGRAGCCTTGQEQGSFTPFLVAIPRSLQSPGITGKDLKLPQCWCKHQFDSQQGDTTRFGAPAALFHALDQCAKVHCANVP